MQRTIELGAPLRHSGLYAHLRIARHGVAGALTLPEYSGLLIKRLAEEGVLDPRLNFAHSVWLSAAEIDLAGRAWRRRRAQSPRQSENEMRYRADPHLQKAGVRIGLGCDNCSCSDAQNMFMAMKLFTLLAAVSDPDPGTAAGDNGAESGHRSRR
jgi:5-methylthioadenosine/S-adenosylhomocysteine deaminase